MYRILFALLALALTGHVYGQSQDTHRIRAVPHAGASNGTVTYSVIELPRGILVHRFIDHEFGQYCISSAGGHGWNCTPIDKHVPVTRPARSTGGCVSSTGRPCVGHTN